MSSPGMMDVFKEVLRPTRAASAFEGMQFLGSFIFAATSSWSKGRYG